MFEIFIDIIFIIYIFFHMYWKPIGNPLNIYHILVIVSMEIHGDSSHISYGHMETYGDFKW